jgi:signal transduction histidine kinase
LVRISLKMVGAELQLTIGDDGLRDIAAMENGPQSGQIVPSLYSIRHRAQAIGARVAFRHFAGKGTFVCIRWQVAERPPRAGAARLASVSRAA